MGVVNVSNSSVNFEVFLKQKDKYKGLKWKRSGKKEIEGEAQGKWKW